MGGRINEGNEGRSDPSESGGIAEAAWLLDLCPLRFLLFKMGLRLRAALGDSWFLMNHPGVLERRHHGLSFSINSRMALLSSAAFTDEFF